MKSKWGSCSSKKNMNFNKLLKYLPDDLIQYVVFHEMTHLKEKKHGKEFWDIISINFKNYQEKENELMDYWFLIQENCIKEV
jgi:predicted metal-dependent hydrolase